MNIAAPRLEPVTLEIASLLRNSVASIWASLTWAGATLAKGPPNPELTIGDVRCDPKGAEGGQAKYLYDCPIETRDPIEVKVTGADFALHKQMTCR